MQCQINIEKEKKDTEDLIMSFSRNVLLKIKFIFIFLLLIQTSLVEIL